MTHAFTARLPQLVGTPAQLQAAMQTLQSTRRQRGSSLSSMMGGMLVTAIALVAAWGVYKLVAGGNEVQIEAKNVAGIIGASKMLKSAGSYTGVSTANLQKIKGFGNMTGSEPGGTVKNTWGGNVTVTGATDSFTITYADVPESACPQFLAMVKDSGMVKNSSACAASGASSLVFKAY